MSKHDTHYKQEQNFWDIKGSSKYVSLSNYDLKRLGNWVDWKGRGTVLDIGGGSGMISEILMQEKNTHCICVDISHNMLKSSLAESVQADALNLPFAENSFDLIVAAAFFHHIPGSELKLMKECLRVLKPGGELIGYDPNGLCLQNKIFMTSGPFRLNTFSPDEKPIVPEKLKQDALDASFNNFEYFTFTFKNPRVTAFEMIQRYLVNPFAVGPTKKYLDRWFFWRTRIQT